MAYIETSGFRLPRKKRELLSILLAIITLVSVLSTVYYSQTTVELQKQNQDLQNSLYNYKPFIYENYSTIATVEPLFYAPSFETRAVLSGDVPIDLKIITPYDGLLTINVKSFNFTYLDTGNDPTSKYLDMDNLKSASISDTGLSTVHQYFVAKDFANSISDHVPVHITVYLKLNLLGNSPTFLSGLEFVLGDAVFEASLFEVRTNQTITQDFNVKVWANLFIPQG